jgi:Fe-S-cluster containining protein
MSEPTLTSLGCARCGACCETIHLGVDPHAMTAQPGSRNAVDLAFIRAHWRHDGLIVNGEQTWTCDRWDADTRECTAHDERPPVCRDFPWYQETPGPQRAAALPPQCSYLGEVPSGQRPAGARPLIPVTVIRG